MIIMTLSSLHGTLIMYGSVRPDVNQLQSELNRGTPLRINSGTVTLDLNPVVYRCDDETSDIPPR